MFEGVSNQIQVVNPAELVSMIAKDTAVRETVIQSRIVRKMAENRRFKKLTAIFAVLVVCAFTLGFPSDVNAKERSLSLQKHYVMIMYSGTRDPVLVDGIFCPMKNGSLQIRANGAPTGCAGAERLALSGFGSGSRRIPSSGTAGATQFDLIFKPREIFGRFYFAKLPGTSLGVRANQPTYFFDAQPGTITVIPKKRQSAEEAIADAKKAMHTQGYGAQADQFKYRLIRAAMVRCGSIEGRQACIFGDEVPYPKWVVVPIIIPF